jgi:hypothetical protein
MQHDWLPSARQQKSLRLLVETTLATSKTCAAGLADLEGLGVGKLIGFVWLENPAMSTYVRMFHGVRCGCC